MTAKIFPTSFHGNTKLSPPSHMIAEKDFQAVATKIQEIISNSLEFFEAARPLPEKELQHLTSRFITFINKLDGIRPDETPSVPRIMDFWLEGCSWIVEQSFYTDDHTQALLLNHLIGSGGQSKVYLGLTHDGLPCVIKYGNSDLEISNEEENLSADEEIEINATPSSTSSIKTLLSRVPPSKHLVHLLASGEWYQIEEFCKFTLSELVYDQDQTIESFLETHRNQISLGILKGIAHLHKYDIIHQDIALDNFLVTEEGVVKICDFGLAIDHKSPVTGGTITYSAPEQMDYFSTVLPKSSDSFNHCPNVWQTMPKTSVEQEKPSYNEEITFPLILKKTEVWQAMLVLAEVNAKHLSTSFSNRLDQYKKDLETITYHAQPTHTDKSGIPNTQKFMEYSTKFIRELIAYRKVNQLDSSGLFSNLSPTTTFEKLLDKMSKFSSEERCSIEEAIEIQQL